MDRRKRNSGFLLDFGVLTRPVREEQKGISLSNARERDNAARSVGFASPRVAGLVVLSVHARPSRNSARRYIREKCKRSGRRAVDRAITLQLLSLREAESPRAKSQADLIINVIEHFF